MAAGYTIKCKARAFTRMKMVVTKGSSKLDIKKEQEVFFITMERSLGANFPLTHPLKVN